MGNNEIAIIFGISSLIFLIINLSYVLKITFFLKQQGYRINYPLLHVKVFQYAQLYRGYHNKMDGSNGKYYNGFVITTILFFCFLAIGIMIAN